MSATTWTATCWQDGPTWVVRLPGLDREARTTRLREVQDVARSLVLEHVAADDGPAEAHVVVDLVARHGSAELLAAAKELREDPDQVSVEAVTLRRGLARALAASGFPVRDVGVLLGVSTSRARSLVGPPAPVRAARAPVPQPRDQGAHDGFRHEALLYDGEAGLVAAAAPFVQDGLDRGQPVLVALPPQQLAQVRAAVVDPTGEVAWVDMSELGGNPARLVPALGAFVDEAGGRAVRGIGQLLWPGRRPAEVEECAVSEALVNLAVDPDTPLWLRCAYDVQQLPEELLVEAGHSHPVLVVGDDYRGSPTYGGAHHATDAFSRGLPEPEVPVEELAFAEQGLVDVRRAVGRRASGLLPAAARADLTLAVSEAATNSVRHGGGSGVLRTWVQDGALVCEVRDRGVIDDPLIGRRRPALDGTSGRGCWMLHQLADLVQVRSGPEGSVVRISTWL